MISYFNDCGVQKYLYDLKKEIEGNKEFGINYNDVTTFLNQLTN